MKKNKKIFIFFMIFITIFIVMPKNTYAFESVTTKIYINQKLSQNSKQEFEYNISEQNGETTKITLTGNEKKELSFTFDQPGNYEYEISLDNDSFSNEWNYTNKTYYIHIYVSENSSGELTSVVTINNEDGLKYEEVAFDIKKIQIDNNANTSNKTTQTSTNNLPITGDDIILYVKILVVSILCVVILIIVKRRTEKNEK